MKIQTIACAIALVTGGLFFTYATNQAIAANEANTVTQGTIQPTAAQALVSRQLATLVDRQHYLNMRLDATTSVRIFDFYIDSLDADHSLFLAPEIETYKKKYAAQFGPALKAGDLAGAYAIHEQYRQRLNTFYSFMLDELKKPQNLNQSNVYIETDREKAPFFKTTAEQRQYWQQILVSQLINLEINKEEEIAKQKALKENPELANGQDLTSPEDLTPVETLTKRYMRQKERLARLKSDEVLDKVLNAMMLSYDPHSNYYPPLDAIELNRQTTLQLEGIGVSIRPERGNEDYIKIETIVEGGPASKSGLIKSGDRIVGIGQDGEKIVDVVGWSSKEIVGLIRGKRGTKVTLRLLGAGASMSQARIVTLVRDVIKEEDAGVRSRIVDIQRDGKNYQYGVIEIPSFYFNYRARRAGAEGRSVSEDTAQALKELNQKDVAGIIIDLRNNPGGSLEEVARMLSQVIKSGPVVQIRDGNGTVNVFQDDDGGKQVYAGPLAVMINLASASASEIYSAAIQDYERGIVIGSTTTGKGTAQVQLDSLAHGQATLTQRKFYRVTGGSTQNKGVIPDIQLVDIYNDAFGERKAKYALEWDTIATAPFKREGSVKQYLPQLVKSSTQRVQLDPQFQYLEQRKQLAQKVEEEKRVVLDIKQRKAELLALEHKYLQAENQRREKTGLKPYVNWESYQAALDALVESRAKMKATQRPPLAEEEAFVIESAQVLLDYANLQKQSVAFK